MPFSCEAFVYTDRRPGVFSWRFRPRAASSLVLPYRAAFPPWRFTQIQNTPGSECLVTSVCSEACSVRTLEVCLRPSVALGKPCKCCLGFVSNSCFERPVALPFFMVLMVGACMPLVSYQVSRVLRPGGKFVFVEVRCLRKFCFFFTCTPALQAPTTPSCSSDSRPRVHLHRKPWYLPCAPLYVLFLALRIPLRWRYA